MLSVSKLDDARQTTIFHGGKVYILDSKEIETSLKSRLEKASIVGHRQRSLWHQRLGHLHKQGMQKLKQLGVVPVDCDLEFCKACVIGKGKRKPHKKHNDARAEEPLAKVHFDIAGPIPVPTSRTKESSATCPTATRRRRMPEWSAPFRPSGTWPLP